jgi:hypothetical protein
VLPCVLYELNGCDSACIPSLCVMPKIAMIFAFATSVLFVDTVCMYIRNSHPSNSDFNPAIEDILLSTFYKALHYS